MKKVLEKFAGLWEKYALSDAGDGCPSCGYGASKLMSDDSYKELLRDIDKRIEEEFGEKAK